ncbi:MAG: hypothetical protein HRU40_21805, partial [Saprospiraceae bacterium]|nr:hypothetical protein [Saprospiraceae bacterium]
TIYIEVTDNDYTEGYLVAADDDDNNNFTSAIKKIRPTANALLRQLTSLDAKPDNVSVEFGIKISGKVGAIIASTQTEANFKVTLSWQKK